MPKKDRLILQQIIDTIESVVPLWWQEAWDNSGLQVGDRNAQIHKALLTTDVTEAVVSEAVSLHCDLIISHHPILFHGLKQVCGQSVPARVVEQAILHKIAIYSAHTTIDSWLHGVSGRMAEKIGMTDYRILASDESESASGLGVIGNLEQPMSFAELLERIKTVFGAPCIRYTEPINTTVQRVALCGGAGAEFIEKAVQQGAEVFITADVKYHEFLDSVGHIAVVDIDHWVSEHFTRDIFAELLAGKVETVLSKTDNTPIKIY